MRLLSLLLCLVAVVAITSDAYGLGIEVGPQTLVVSSGGHNLTIHTTHKGYPADDVKVVLTIAGNVVAITHTHLDDRGYFVARCTRQAAVKAVGEFDGKFTTATVVLAIGGDSGAQTIRVRK